MDSGAEKEEPYIYVISGVNNEGPSKVTNHVSYSIDDDDSAPSSPSSGSEHSSQWLPREAKSTRRKRGPGEANNKIKAKMSKMSSGEEGEDEDDMLDDSDAPVPPSLTGTMQSPPRTEANSGFSLTREPPSDQPGLQSEESGSLSPGQAVTSLSVIKPTSLSFDMHSPTKSNSPQLEDTEKGSPVGKKFVKPSNMPETTASSTRWAVSVFQKWNKQRESEKCPDQFLEECREPRLIEKWLKVFVTEGMFNKNGDPYPPETIYGIMCGLMRYMKQCSPNGQVPNFLDKNNQDFAELHAIMDELFNKLRDLGVGADKQHIEPLTMEDEKKLWDTGVLGRHNPQSLIKALFYLNGKKFGLRGGREHHNLKLSHLIRQTNPDRYIYVGTKSRQRSSGGMCLSSFRRVQNKEIVSYYDPSAGDRCHVKLLDEYIQRLPPEAKEDDSFYYQPLPYGSPTGPWYRRQRVGVNTLRSMVKTMCALAGISGRKTNNSLHICCGNHYESYADEGADDRSSPDTPGQTSNSLGGHIPVQTTTNLPPTPTSILPATNIATLPISVIKTQPSQSLPANLPPGITNLPATAIANFPPGALNNFSGTPIATLPASAFTNLSGTSVATLPNISGTPLATIPTSALGKPLTNLTPKHLANLVGAQGMAPIPLIPSTTKLTNQQTTLVNNSMDRNNTPTTTGKGPELGGIAYLCWPGSTTTIPVVVTPQIVLTYQLALQAEQRASNASTTIS